MIIIFILSQFLITIILINGATIKSSPHQCIHYSNKVRKNNGFGDTVGACMNCNTARPQCYGDCQAQLDILKVACNDVCLPDGYFFDAASTLNGCWEDIERQIGIEMEKCGCNSASSFHKNYIFVIITIISLLYFIIYI